MADRDAVGFASSDFVWSEEVNITMTAIAIDRQDERIDSRPLISRGK